MQDLTPDQVTELTKSYSQFLHDYVRGSGEPIHPLDFQDADGDRLLHAAALRGDLQSVEWLLDAGENINAVGDMGLTPAHYAAGGLHKEVFDLLIRRGADLTIVDEFGNTAPERWSFFEQIRASKTK